MFGATPSTSQKGAANVLRKYMRRLYRKKLLKDCIDYLRTLHGDGWISNKLLIKDEKIKHDIKSMQDVIWRAMQDIIWRSTEKQYQMGYRLIFSRFLKNIKS